MDTHNSAPSVDQATDLPPILLVDDEHDILQSLRRLLRKKFAITATTEPNEALHLLKENTYAVLLTDQRMPTMEGTALLNRAQDIAPDTVRIILTGYADINAAMEAINQGGAYRFLQKPWDDADLMTTLSQAASYFALQQENKRLHALNEAQKEKLKEFNRSTHARAVERKQKVDQLKAELKNTFTGILSLLITMADMYSPVLGLHAKKVTRLAMRIGSQMALSNRDLFQLEVAATLHDIGKIGMNADLLRKRYSTLSTKEKAALLPHAVTGSALVRRIPHLEDASLFVRHHHERYDGTGFPDRLFARNIPLGARIIAAADLYDNLLNGRITSQDTTQEKAIEYLNNCRSKELDPEVVDALLEVLQTHDEFDDDSEIEMNVDDLQVGMTLSKHAYNAQGHLILPKDTLIDGPQLYQLMKYHKITPLKGIYVYRGSLHVLST